MTDRFGDTLLVQTTCVGPLRGHVRNGHCGCLLLPEHSVEEFVPVLMIFEDASHAARSRGDD
jgi:hypothetical protein